MDLAQKLLAVPERENAGARSSNRFSFQQVWAFDYMLKIIESNIDFVLFMEFHDDIIVLNRCEQEEYVEFFQIKTDDKDSRQSQLPLLQRMETSIRKRCLLFKK